MSPIVYLCLPLEDSSILCLKSVTRLRFLGGVQHSGARGISDSVYLSRQKAIASTHRERLCRLYDAVYPIGVLKVRWRGWRGRLLSSRPPAVTALPPFPTVTPLPPEWAIDNDLDSDCGVPNSLFHCHLPGTIALSAPYQKPTAC